jgi:Cu-processing system permease protein
MRKILIISKMTLLENSRKQIFHVLCLVILAIIAGSTLLSLLTEGAKLKIIKDLAMTTILFGGAVLSVALAASSIPNDIESRTIYPLFARPITRSQYVIGKYLGTISTVGLGLLAMSFVFLVLIVSYEGKFDPYLLPAMLFTYLQVCIIAAFTTTLSMFFSPAITSAMSFMIYLFGSIKMGYLDGLINKSVAVSKTVIGFIAHLLPNLESFNFKNALVHHDSVPISYLVQVFVYGIVYIVFSLCIGAAAFSKKEV